MKLKQKYRAALKWLAVFTFLGLAAYMGLQYKRHGNAFLTRVAMAVDISPYVFPAPSSYSHIPAYDLIVTRNDLQKLDRLVARQKTRRQESYYKIKDFYRPFEEGEKIEIPGTFLYGGERYRARISLRGDGSNHWKDRKRSYRIEFKDRPFLGSYETNLIIPVDRGIIAEEWAMRMARLMGVLAPQSRYASLRINGEDFGLYWQLQQLGPWFLEKNLRPRRSPIYKGEFERKYWFTEYGNSSVFNNLGGWGIHKRKKFDNNYTPVFYLIKRMEEIEKGERDIESLFELVDKESLMRWITHAYVCGSNHYDEYHNNKFYFNNSTGKLEPIAWDTHLLEYFGEKHMNSNRLIALLMTHPEYRYERNRRAYEFVTKHREQMVEVYDDIKDTILLAYLGDTKKKISNLNVLWRIKKYRNTFLLPNIQKITDNMSKCRLTSTVFVGRDALEVKAQVDGFSSVSLDGLSLVFNAPDEGAAPVLDFALSLSGPYGYRNFTWRGPAEPEVVQEEANKVRYRIPWQKKVLYAAASREGGLLAPAYEIEIDFSPRGMEFSGVDIEASNAVTRGPCDSVERYVFPEDGWDFHVAHMDRDTFIESHGIFAPGKGENEVVLKGGVHKIDSDLLVPANLEVRVEAPAELRFEREASLISYGKVVVAPNARLSLKPIDGERWGVFGLMGKKTRGSVLRNIAIDRGGEDVVRGVLFTGALSVHDSKDITVENCKITNCRGDDGINFQFVDTGVIKGCRFEGCIDGVDIDYSTEIALEENTLIDNLNDGIDLGGGAEAFLRNNIIERSADKGISVGEGSKAEIIKNVIKGCNLGVAVKDEATARIEHNSFMGNTVAITQYFKKMVWGEPEVHEAENTFVGNKKDRFSGKSLKDVEELVSSLTASSRH